MKKLMPYCLTLLATLAVTVEAYSQITLTGTVKDEKGESLIGANVLIKHTGIGTAADINGNFKLDVAESFNDSTLVISSIGYVTQELAIKERRVFDVILVEDAKTLTEVVVTGYQTEERGKILGSVATVSPELITKIPVFGAVAV